MLATGAMSRDEIEIEIVVERRIDGVRRDGQHQRVAVRRRSYDDLGADIAAGARPIVDEEWLPEPLRQPLTDQARDDVGRAAGRNSHDQTHRPRRICLRSRDARHDRERGSARCQVQECAAGKFHSVQSAGGEQQDFGTSSLADQTTPLPVYAVALGVAAEPPPRCGHDKTAAAKVND